MLTKVYNMSGEQVGEIELSEAVFGIAPNAAVVHDVTCRTPTLGLAFRPVSRSPMVKAHPSSLHRIA